MAHLTEQEDLEASKRQAEAFLETLKKLYWRSAAKVFLDRINAGPEKPTTATKGS
mgnify:FL=1